MRYIQEQISTALVLLKGSPDKVIQTLGYPSSLMLYHWIHARYHAQCILALFFEDYFFSHEYCQEINPLPVWLKLLLSEMQKVENFRVGYSKMCDLANCTHNHLNRIMKKYTNKTPMEYINEQKLNYLLYLLSQTSMSILEVAETCGFSNLSHFYHLFRKLFGQTPFQIRKGR